MRLSSSTGDFKGYVPSVADAVREFGKTKFKYINLEQPGTQPEYSANDDNGWREVAEDWARAAEDARVKYVISHAPCLNAYERLDEEHYQTVVRAMRRAIEICGILGIDRIVVHASSNEAFDKPEFIARNKKFYGDLFDVMEKHCVSVLLENMHELPYYTFSTGTEIREFLDEVNHPLLGACFDTAHCNMNRFAREIGQYNNIIALGDKLMGLHISDNLSGSGHQHTWPFAGIINFDEVMQGLIDIHYCGYFNFEASYTLINRNNPPQERKAWIKDG